MLLKERSPGGGAPVIILRDWDYLVHWNVHGFNSVEFQCVKPQKLGFWIELHSQNKTLWSKGGFNHEWKHGVYFGFEVSFRSELIIGLAVLTFHTASPSTSCIVCKAVGVV